jgi:hypothetical protein
LTWKPVPQMIASAWWCTPSSVTMPSATISRMPVVTTSTFGWLSAG